MTQINKTTTNLYHSAAFLKSCAEADQVPYTETPEVAFVGRSNAGKSSTLNKLCEHTGLAKVSKTPGRTQLLNFFRLSNGCHLVDLPGYGFARAPKDERRKWGRLIEAYLMQRENLKGLIVIMDARHPMTDHDIKMLSWCEASRLPAHVLLNKSDKLSQSEISLSLRQTKDALKQFELDISMQTFSASKGTGLSHLRAKLNEWLSVAPATESEGKESY